MDNIFRNIYFDKFIDSNTFYVLLQILSDHLSLSSGTLSFPPTLLAQFRTVTFSTLAVFLAHPTLAAEFTSATLAEVFRMPAATVKFGTSTVAE